MKSPSRIRVVSFASLMFIALLGTAPWSSAGQARLPKLNSAGGQPRVKVQPFEEQVEEPQSPGTATPLLFKYDDGSFEEALGYNNGDPDNNIPPTRNWQIVYVNRFTPDPQDLPVTIDKVSILFPITNSNLRPGLPF
jgi:hypothetical protein